MKSRLIILLFFIFIDSISSQTNSIKLLLDKSKNLDMRDLVELAKNNIDDERELASFFYYWIGENIQYDHKFFKKLTQVKDIHKEYLDKQDEYTVYEKRKGICGGFANLFQWFMNEIDIESVIIFGYIRDERNHYVDLGLDSNFSHAWNGIKINNKWILIDSTWGTSKDSTVSDFYFDMRPDLAIITHYPKENKWQLLKEPLSLEDFNKSKFVKPVWFHLGFSDVPKLKTDGKYYYLVFKTNTKENWSVNLEYSIDNLSFKPVENLVKINQEGFTFIKFDKDKIPKKAFFKVNLYKLGILPLFDVINFKT